MLVTASRDIGIVFSGAIDPGFMHALSMALFANMEPTERRSLHTSLAYYMETPAQSVMVAAGEVYRKEV